MTALALSGNGELINAEGQALGVRDGSIRMLHVLPELNWGRVEQIDLANVRLEVRSRALGEALQPMGGIRLGRPLPNDDYVVGGCADTRFGWMVPIGDLELVDLEFIWKIAGPEVRRQRVVTHSLELALPKGAHNTYTMHMASWHGYADMPEPPLRRQLVSWLSAALLAEVQPARWSSLVAMQDDGDSVEMTYREKATLPCLPMDRLWGLNEFQPLQLHERERSAEFSTGNEEHRAAASLAMPAEVMCEAIELALAIPYDARNPPRGYYPSHPAVKLLCQWWNENAPEELRTAVAAMPWVRVDGEGEYVCGYCERPDAPVSSFSPVITARVEELVLMEFFQEHRPAAEGGIEVVGVDGATLVDVGVEWEDVETGRYHEAYYTLEALATFPVRFPEAWAALQLQGR